MNKKLLIGLVFVAVFITGAIGIKFVKSNQSSTSSSAKSSLEEIQQKVIDGFSIAAEQINQSAPTMVDEETRLDKASVGPGALLTYHYTLPNFVSDDLDANFINTVFAHTKEFVCTTKEMKPAMQYGGAYGYSYSSYDGVHIGEFIIDRDTCGFSAADY